MQRHLFWIPVLFLFGWFVWQSDTPAQSAPAVPLLLGEGRGVGYAVAVPPSSEGSGVGTVAVLPSGGEGTTLRVSVASDGTQANAGSSDPSISADGLWVAFYSAATNLTPDDTNEFTDVFLHEIATGETTLITRGWDGSPANWHSGFNYPAILLSANGGVVAFTSNASNLVQGENATGADCYAHERATGVTELVSVNSAEQQVGNTYCELGDISADGRYITFSALNRYDSTDLNDHHDVYLRDRVTGTTTRISRQPHQFSARHDAISDDGRFIDYYVDTPSEDYIYRYDRVEESFEVLTTLESDIPPYAQPLSPEMAGDGSATFFVSEADDLPVPNMPGADIFRRSYPGGAIALISERGTTDTPDNMLQMKIAGVSSDGNHTLFQSNADNVVPGLLVNSVQGYMRNQELDYTQPIYMTYDGTWMEGILYFSPNVAQSLSGDGRRVVLSSPGNNLVVGDTNEASDIFVRFINPVPPSTPTPTITPTRLPNALYLPLIGRGRAYWSGPRLTNLTAGANGASSQPAISVDGGRVAFLSEASNLVPADTNGDVDAFVWERTGNLLRLVSGTTTGAQVNGDILSVDISADGRYVLMRTKAKLDPRDTNTYADIYRYDIETNVTEWVSIGLNGDAPDGESTGADISADGRYVVFSSEARNISTIPLPATCFEYACATLYRRDMQTGVTETWFVDEYGGALAPLVTPSLSADGQSAAYRRINSGLYHYEGATGTLTQISPDDYKAAMPLLADNFPGALYEEYQSDISQGGRSLFYVLNTYARDGGEDGREIWFLGQDSSPVPLVSVHRYAYDIVANGSRVAFSAPDLIGNGEYVTRPYIPDDRNDTQDVYRYDYPSGEYERVSDAPDGTQGNGDSYYPALSADGRIVAFVSEANNLVPGDSDILADIFVWEGVR